jgi:hypothetical protein
VKQAPHFMTCWRTHMPGDDINMTEEMIDVLAHATVRHMTPLEIGRILHPTAIAVALKHVPWGDHC